jgi:GTP-binding protein
MRSLELKVLADVGLVGFPNAGKSSLLAATTAARPEIANYPFTTLTPNLGIVKYRDHRSFIMADIPGIIENAHLGKGLGLRFLRHIERNSVLLFLVPIDSEDICSAYQILLRELQMYNPELTDKPRMLAITKCDLVEEEWIDLIRPDIQVDVPVCFISSVSGKGIDTLKDMLWRLMNVSEEELGGS